MARNLRTYEHKWLDLSSTGNQWRERLLWGIEAKTVWSSGISVDPRQSVARCPLSFAFTVFFLTWKQIELMLGKGQGFTLSSAGQVES